MVLLNNGCTKWDNFIQVLNKYILSSISIDFEILVVIIFTVNNPLSVPIGDEAGAIWDQGWDCGGQGGHGEQGGGQ